MKPGLMINLTKPDAVEFARSLLTRWHDQGVDFLLPPEEGQALGQAWLPMNDFCQKASFVVVVGGDGTFLRAARRIQDIGAEVPLFGVNMGHLGFLATSTPDLFDQHLQDLLQGKGEVTRRRLIEGFIKKGASEQPIYALNDVVLYKGCGAKMISVDVSLRGRSISTMRADGVILSTPTGSTAYALSAGGPIVPPHVACTILAPLCAHTLYWRPLVLSAEDQVTLTLMSEQDASVSVDGLDAIDLPQGGQLELWLSDRAVSVMNLQSFDYFDLLHRKLMWGFDPVGGAHA